jgi:hypothetical protein
MDSLFPEGAEEMNDVLARYTQNLLQSDLHFSTKPILIGGMAMEYYGIRKAGADVDLVITDEDYQGLARRYPEKRKDLYGDLGLVIGPFEIWRSIAHLDYDFFKKEAIEKDDVLVISIDRLLWTRVCAMDTEKYRNDLFLIREYYYREFTNKQFHREAELHEKSYEKRNGVVFGGKYED